MWVSRLDKIRRRTFMKRTAQLSVAGAASSYGLGLAGISELAAQSNGDDYKALVCVFMLGGNDHANTLIPFDAENYTRYSAIRGGGSGTEGVALPQSSLSATVLNPGKDQTLEDDITLALAPTMPRLKSFFDRGVMAPLLNVGPLLAPITRAQFENGSETQYPRPRKLFSHNDQQSTWQSFQPEGATSGWGGRIADLVHEGNTNSMFTSIGADGDAVFLRGETAVPFRVGQKGPITVSAAGGSLFGSQAAGASLEAVMRQQSGHVLENDYATLSARSLEYGPFIRDVLANTSASAQFNEDIGLEAQLSTVSKLIARRGELGVSRQVFLVSIGGFDHHRGLLGSHEALLGVVDAAISKFYDAMMAMGLSNRVTTFTASDFGRTLTPNGDGTDHGWGGHHFVIGGDVIGSQFYGEAPSISVDSDDQVGRGRLLPTTSVDQYAATLAKWFGVSARNFAYIAPNIGRFASSDLGFLAQEA